MIELELEKAFAQQIEGLERVIEFNNKQGVFDNGADEAILAALKSKGNNLYIAIRRKPRKGSNTWDVFYLAAVEDDGINYIINVGESVANIVHSPNIKFKESEDNVLVKAEDIWDTSRKYFEEWLKYSTYEEIAIACAKNVTFI
jgi:hypothetical protein